MILGKIAERVHGQCSAKHDMAVAVQTGCRIHRKKYIKQIRGIQ